MKNTVWASGVLAAVFALPAFSADKAGHVEHLCTGFAPENDRWIPESMTQDSSMTQAKFNAILDKIQAVYAPVIRSKGGNLVINRYWSDGTVNASANRNGNNWIINMYGGMARHPRATEDGFALVACHELGHHLGGAPKNSGSWASNEGQSDYFGSLQCLKNVFAADDNIAIVRGMELDPVVTGECRRLHNTEDQIALCERISMAGFSSANVLADLSNAQTPRFDTPDPRQVSQTNNDHPAAQCRLDTYYQGTLCGRSPNEALSNTDPNVGTCNAAAGDTLGLRPRCWFKPSGATTPPPSPKPTPAPTPAPSIPVSTIIEWLQKLLKRS